MPGSSHGVLEVSHICLHDIDKGTQALVLKILRQVAGQVAKLESSTWYATNDGDVVLPLSRAVRIEGRQRNAELRFSGGRLILTVTGAVGQNPLKISDDALADGTPSDPGEEASRRLMCWRHGLETSDDETERASRNYNDRLTEICYGLMAYIPVSCVWCTVKLEMDGSHWLFVLDDVGYLEGASDNSLIYHAIKNASGRPFMSQPLSAEFDRLAHAYVHFSAIRPLIATEPLEIRIGSPLQKTVFNDCSMDVVTRMRMIRSPPNDFRLFPSTST
jgi:hypothetical protein